MVKKRSPGVQIMWGNPRRTPLPEELYYIEGRNPSGMASMQPGSYTEFLDYVGALIEPEPGEDGCWIWKGAKTGPYGPHRSLYQWLRGKIDDDLVLHHICEVKLCVNPDHLEPMTNSAHLELHTILRMLSRR